MQSTKERGRNGGRRRPGTSAFSQTRNRATLSSRENKREMLSTRDISQNMEVKHGYRSTVEERSRADAFEPLRRDGPTWWNETAVERAPGRLTIITILEAILRARRGARAPRAGPVRRSIWRLVSGGSYGAPFPGAGVWIHAQQEDWPPRPTPRRPLVAPTLATTRQWDTEPQQSSIRGTQRGASIHPILSSLEACLLPRDCRLREQRHASHEHRTAFEIPGKGSVGHSRRKDGSRGAESGAADGRPAQAPRTSALRRARANDQPMPAENRACTIDFSADCAAARDAQPKATVPQKREEPAQSDSK